MTWIGMKQLSPLELTSTIQEGLQSDAMGQEANRRRRQVKAQAYAQVCHMFGIRYAEMSESQKALAQSIERRMLGESTETKGYGFSIPGVSERRPNSR